MGDEEDNLQVPMKNGKRPQGKQRGIGRGKQSEQPQYHARKQPSGSPSGSCAPFSDVDRGVAFKLRCLGNGEGGWRQRQWIVARLRRLLAAALRRVDTLAVAGPPCQDGRPGGRADARTSVEAVEQQGMVAGRHRVQVGRPWRIRFPRPARRATGLAEAVRRGGGVSDGQLTTRNKEIMRCKAGWPPPGDR